MTRDCEHPVRNFNDNLPAGAQARALPAKKVDFLDTTTLSGCACSTRIAITGILNVLYPMNGINADQPTGVFFAHLKDDRSHRKAKRDKVTDTQRYRQTHESWKKPCCVSFMQKKRSQRLPLTMGNPQAEFAEKPSTGSGSLLGVSH